MTIFIAKNKSDEIIEIYEAIKEGEYYCPECSGDLLVKDGDIYVKHFAHKTKLDCDTWGEMSEWHLGWQRKFDISVREVVLTKENKKHRADVFISVKGINLTLEFQKSPISRSEILTRNSFYNHFGKMLWIFNLSDKHIKKDNTKEYKNLIRYNWVYPSKSILLPKEFAEMNVDFCFQLPNGEIVFPCGVERGSWKQFYVKRSETIHKDKLTEKIKNDYFIQPYTKSDFILNFKTPGEYYRQVHKKSMFKKYEELDKDFDKNELTQEQIEAIEFGLVHPDHFKKYPKGGFTS